MRITWVISEEIHANALDMNIVKAVAPSWGSWKVWKHYRIDNTVCIDVDQADNLIKRALHAVTNLYVPQSAYVDLGSPIGVRLFDGSFTNDNITNGDDIVALNLATPNTDLVLMSGFNFQPLLNTDTEILRLAREQYYFNVRAIMHHNRDVQFVLVDYNYEQASWLKQVDNLTIDSMNSVKNLLV